MTRDLTATQPDQSRKRPFASEAKTVRVDPEFLASIATDSDRVPTLYYSRYGLVRYFFWMRLELALKNLLDCAPRRGTVLDFGGGGGVFLPTLSKYFDRATCVDLEDIEARLIVEHYDLTNVELIRADVEVAAPGDAPFDAIVAADVLEHFSDLSVAVDAIDRWIGSDGVLVTSSPVEDRLYEVLRKVFHVVKPWDHYHSAREVEAYLEQRGYEAIRRRYVPLPIRVPSVFFVTAWRKR